MCARKPKGFGRGAQIEGLLIPGQRVLLVEDLATDGKSKANFINALREADGKCDHCFVIFFYDIYPQSKKIMGDLGVTLHALTTWKDVLAVAKTSGNFEPKMLAEVEKFIERSGRLVESARRRRRGCGVALRTCGAVKCPLIPSKAGIRATIPAVRLAPGIPLARERAEYENHPTFAGLTSFSIRVTARSSADRNREISWRLKGGGPRVVAPAERKSVNRSRVASAMPIESSVNGLPVGPITPRPSSRNGRPAEYRR